MPANLAIVTGTSSGIGLRTTVTLARSGYRVIATMRDLNRRNLLEQTAAESTSNIDIQLLDVTNPADIARLASYVAERYPRPDYALAALINNAGFAMGGFAEDTSIEELRRQFDTNFFGSVSVTRAFLPRLRQQRAGHIVMVSSVLGRTGSPGVSSYAASKFALEGWTETLRMELRSLNIRVALVEPGAFATDIWTRNVEVAAGTLSEFSPNRARSSHFTNKVKSSPKADPQAVADLILKIITTRDPTLRHIIGKDAAGAMLLRRFLPWSVFEKLVIKSSNIDS